MIVESQKTFLRLLVEIKLALECDGIASIGDVGRTAINAVAVLGWHERINKNTLLLIADLFGIVNAAAILALMLILFNIDKYVIGQANVHEGIQAATVGLKGLSFNDCFWEIG